jgi:hypothetical protein
LRRANDVRIAPNFDVGDRAADHHADQGGYQNNGEKSHCCMLEWLPKIVTARRKLRFALF